MYFEIARNLPTLPLVAHFTGC